MIKDKADTMQIFEILVKLIQILKEIGLVYFKVVYIYLLSNLKFLLFFYLNTLIFNKWSTNYFWLDFKVNQIYYWKDFKCSKLTISSWVSQYIHLCQIHKFIITLSVIIKTFKLNRII